MEIMFSNTIKIADKEYGANIRLFFKKNSSAKKNQKKLSSSLGALSVLSNCKFGRTNRCQRSFRRWQRKFRRWQRSFRR
jgi:hypothetical protein